MSMSELVPSSRGGGAAPRGLFLNGVWHCNCTPRQPANHFEVKKQGPNHGKWFRTCQKQKNDKSRCRFFLWDGDAHPREAAALANNTRTELSHLLPTTPPKRRSSSPKSAASSGHDKSSRKRDFTATLDSDDEYGYGANEAFQTELDNIMTAVETPRKVAKTSELATPSVRRVLPWKTDDRGTAESSGLQTPQTSRTVRTRPFAIELDTPLFNPLCPIGKQQPGLITSPSPCETPSPNRFKDMGVDNLAHDVFSLLQGANVTLNTATEKDLTFLLSNYAKHAEGLRRGRDVTRATIVAKDAKITELAYRIGTLEAELEAEKALIKHIRWESQAIR